MTDVHEDRLRFLFELLATPTPSGFEHEGQRRWLASVAPAADRTWHDAYGNCFAELLPRRAVERPATVAVFGHIDEIGLMAAHIDERGFVYCKAIGGIDPATIVGKRISFRSSVDGVDEPVLGVVGATATHLQDKTVEGKVRKLHELFIDIGAPDRGAAERRLRIGDPGVFAEGPQRIGADLLVARALDNRAGAWVAAETLARVSERRDELRCRLVAVSTVQEEVGLVGAEMLAEGLRPDVALVTDVGHATDSPGISNAQHGMVRLAGGPRIAVGATLHPAIVARLEAIAARTGIPLQRFAVPGKTGTDTDAIFRRGGGIPSALVSLPIRYMHTTVEMTSLADLDRIAALFTAFALDLADGERFVAQI
ncbi:MAG TPA: M20/M25/M40 family metallo-hydrolase [Phycisphaerales bacterium]|nr:M20/M25/M40 family metallo-hydrolase [Phycisphaerales bacterium]HMP36189.1 M20/M25/M40 family metallo-hydrolase [Phycisphaerales bacterium]